MLQCVYSRKSDEKQNGRFLHFSRHFTLKPLVRWLCMLRELCRTFNMAHHIQYQDGLQSQSILQAYIMMLQCVYSRKSDENGRFLPFTRHYPKTMWTVAMYAPEIVKNLQYGSPHPISRWFTQPIHSAGIHHDVAVCLFTKKWRKWLFSSFYQTFTLKPLVRWLCMLRELCRTFNMAHHIQYQDGLHSQFIVQAYIMMLWYQCFITVLYVSCYMASF